MSIPGGIGGNNWGKRLQQLTPHDQWEWNSRHHWKHWHGLWTMWKPTEGPDIMKIYKPVRSLWPVDEERVHLYHRNTSYETTEKGPDINWESGPWAMYEFKHSLQDGIWHPNSLDHRIIRFSNGDLGWVRLALKPNDPKSVVFNELHFMPCELHSMPCEFNEDFNRGEKPFRRCHVQYLFLFYEVTPEIDFQGHLGNPGRGLNHEPVWAHLLRAVSHGSPCVESGFSWKYLYL